MHLRPLGHLSWASRPPGMRGRRPVRTETQSEKRCVSEPTETWSEAAMEGTLGATSGGRAGFRSGRNGRDERDGSDGSCGGPRGTGEARTSRTGRTLRAAGTKRTARTQGASGGLRGSREGPNAGRADAPVFGGSEGRGTAETSGTARTRGSSERLGRHCASGGRRGGPRATGRMVSSGTARTRGSSERLGRHCASGGRRGGPRATRRMVSSERLGRTGRQAVPAGAARDHTLCAQTRRCGERGIQSDCDACGVLSSWPPCGSGAGPQLDVRRGPLMGRRLEPSTTQPTGHEARQRAETVRIPLNGPGRTVREWCA